MGLNKYAKRRDKNEGIIVDALQIKGAEVHRLDRPVDLLIGYRGETVLAEVKAPRANLSTTQQEWREAWQGGRVVVLRTIDDAMALIDDLDASRSAA